MIQCRLMSCTVSEPSLVMRTVYWNTQSLWSGREFSGAYRHRTSTRMLLVTASDIGAISKWRSFIGCCLHRVTIQHREGGTQSRAGSNPPSKSLAKAKRRLKAALLSLAEIAEQNPSNAQRGSRSVAVGEYLRKLRTEKEHQRGVVH